MLFGTAGKNVDAPPQLLREVVLAARRGNRQLAQNLLKQIISENPENEQALLWAAALSDSQEEGAIYLERVLRVNPMNRQAINTLAMQRLDPQLQLFRAPTSASPPKLPTTPSGSKPESLAKQQLEELLPPKATPIPVPHAPQAEQPRLVTQQKVLQFRKLLARSWSCPVCETPAAEPQTACPQCGCLSRLEDLLTASSVRKVEERIVTEAISSWSRRAAGDSNFDACMGLAKAHLNLYRSAESVHFLRHAMQLKPDAAEVEAALKTLERRKLVLAVDDSLTMRRVLAIFLERSGYRVLTAADGMQALALLHQHTPSLILLDITMPRMDGYQVCKTIRDNPYTKKIPVVFLSGNDGFFDKMKGKLAGATEYVTKPFQEEKLLKAVQNHLGKSPEV